MQSYIRLYPLPTVRSTGPSLASTITTLISQNMIIDIDHYERESAG